MAKVLTDIAVSPYSYVLGRLHEYLYMLPVDQKVKLGYSRIFMNVVQYRFSDAAYIGTRAKYIFSNY